MPRRKKAQTTVPSGPGPTPAPRSTLHEVLRGRKAAPHRPRQEKRRAQKLRREVEEG